MGARGVVARDGASHAVGADPALATGLLNHVQRLADIEPHLLRHHQHLGGGHQVDATGQVVDEFGARAVPHAFADAEQLVRQCVEKALMARKHVGGAGHHQAHAAIGRPRGAARHGRINRVQAQRNQFLGEAFGVLRRHGRAQHHGAPQVHGLGDAIHTKQHLAGLLGRHDTDNDYYKINSYFRSIGEGYSP